MTHQLPGQAKQLEIYFILFLLLYYCNLFFWCFAKTLEELGHVLTHHP